MSRTPVSNANNIHVHSMIPADQKNITTKCCRQHREDQVIGHHDKTHRTKNKPTGSYHKQKDAEYFKWTVLNIYIYHYLFIEMIHQHMLSYRLNKIKNFFYKVLQDKHAWGLTINGNVTSGIKIIVPSYLLICWVAARSTHIFGHDHSTMRALLVLHNLCISWTGF